MPNYTYPNQRTINIHRERATSDFLGIKNENWQDAAKDLGAHALMLYLYLASNANNYTLSLSPAAIREAIGMARSTYHDQFHKLMDKGYLVHSHGNTYAFYERPQSVARVRSEEFSDGQANKIGTGSSISPTTAVQSVDQQNTEINNRESVNNGGINNEIKVPEVKTIFIKSPEVMTKERAKLLGYKKEETFEF